MITLQRDQRGALSALLLPLVVVSLLLVLSAVFGVWAYGQMKNYKDNSDQISADAVSAAIKKEDTKKAAEYAEAAKNPLKVYNGPSAFGGLHVEYPRTWSAYVVEQNAGSTNIDGYFNPNFVPSVNASSSSFALRVRIQKQSFASTMQTFQGNIKAKKLTSTPFAFTKVPSAIGNKLEGQISPDKQGTMIVVPLRDNTLEVWAETADGVTNLTTYILPNFNFSP